MSTYLVVDDSTTVRMAIVKALHNAKRAAHVVEASNGKDATRLFMEHDCRIVFLDMVLETSTTSVDLAHAFLAARPETRIVLVTGLGREEPDVVKLISAGAFAYLRKPIRDQDIKNVLQDIEAEEGNIGRIR